MSKNFPNIGNILKKQEDFYPLFLKKRKMSRSDLDILHKMFVYKHRKLKFSTLFNTGLDLFFGYGKNE